MPNLVDVTYAQTGESTKTNSFGMREMQAQGVRGTCKPVSAAEGSASVRQVASTMFLALDKLFNQG